MTIKNEPTLSLCPNCYCMTKTISGKCGKCKESKPLVDDINVTRKMQNKSTKKKDFDVDLDIEFDTFKNSVPPILEEAIQNEPHVRDINVPKNEPQLSEIYEPEYDLNDIVRELLVMMAETNPSNLKTCKYLLEEMDKWGKTV